MDFETVFKILVNELYFLSVEVLIKKQVDGVYSDKIVTNVVGKLL